VTADIRYSCHGIVNQFRPDRGPEHPCPYPAKWVVPSNIEKLYRETTYGPTIATEVDMKMWPVRVCGYHNRAWLRTVRI
jgi:hypothetical protein